MNKRRHDILAIALTSVGVLLVIGVTLFFIYNMTRPVVNVYLGDSMFAAHLATTPQARSSGIEQAGNLGREQALLMVYPDDSHWKVSSEGLRGSVDVVWINEKHEIVYIVKNITPENATLKTFSPPVAARYVLLLPGGAVEARSIAVNKKAQFQFEEEVQ